MADEYELEFAPKELGSELIKKFGRTDLASTSSPVPTTAKEELDANTQSVKTGTRTVSVTAGMSILQFIDQQMRNSTYIMDQSNVYYDEVTKKQEKRTALGNVAWYKISVQATPITSKKDNKRNDFAYKIKYVITPYAISQTNSEYFPDPVFRGLHKSYNYWFTGLNKEILSFEQDMNLQYKTIISGSNAPALVRRSTNNRDIQKSKFQPASDQSSMGASGKTNEPGANLADSLYNYGNLANIRLKIVGDPAWLQQGEISTGVSAGTFDFKPFNDDGTINFSAGDIVFDITWNRPQDYNMNTGLMETKGTGSQDPENATYYAVEVKSTFKGGAFTQELKGSLLVSNPSNTGANKSTTRSATNNNTDPGSRELINDDTYDPDLNTGSRAAGTMLNDDTYDPELNANSNGGLNSPMSQPGINTVDEPASLLEPGPESAPTHPESDGELVELSGGAELEISGPPKLPAYDEESQTEGVNTPPQLMNKEY